MKNTFTEQLLDVKTEITVIETEIARIKARISDLEQADMIAQINNGEADLEKYSRWSVYNAYLAGHLKAAPASIRPALNAILDSCRESL